MDSFFTAYSAEIAALAAALLWSTGSLFGAEPARILGTFAFNRIRMSMALVALTAMTLLRGGFASVPFEALALLLGSGFVGIFVGDSLFYMAVNRIGPRRCNILFTLNAPFAAMLGFMVFAERLSLLVLLGVVLVPFGIFLAIAFGKRAANQHRWEHVHGSLAAGIGLALGAALCQALGSVLARPALHAGMDPVAAGAIRMALAAFLLWNTLWFKGQAHRQKGAVTPRLLWLSFGNATVSMILGTPLLLYALRHGPVGVVSTLSALSPVFILPWIWLITKERPAAGAWVGAMIAVAGVACIVNGKV